MANTRSLGPQSGLKELDLEIAIGRKCQRSTGDSRALVE
jgi:hypothetical protein